MERHRIHELFPQNVLIGIEQINNDPLNRDNNTKIKKIMELLNQYGFSYIGSGTNRMCVRHFDYVFKIALDRYGVRDNWNEFKYTKELQPYVTKTYECNGLVVVAEYVNVLSKKEFKNSIPNIRAILSELSRNWIFIDMGTIAKNYMNCGYRDNGSLVFLDYGYIYPKDEKIMFCKKCGSHLKWNPDFSALNCTRCGKAHSPLEIRDRMWNSDPVEKRFFKGDEKKQLVINVEDIDI